jgi:hypothetical protein
MPVVPMLYVAGGVFTSGTAAAPNNDGRGGAYAGGSTQLVKRVSVSLAPKVAPRGGGRFLSYRTANRKNGARPPIDILAVRFLT